MDKIEAVEIADLIHHFLCFLEIGWGNSTSELLKDRVRNVFDRPESFAIASGDPVTKFIPGGIKEFGSMKGGLCGGGVAHE